MRRRRCRARLEQTPRKRAALADRFGFSLLELIVVLTLLAILTSAVIPLYSRSVESLRGERAMRDLYATLKFAQERAIAETTEYRVYLDDEKGTYWLARLTGYSKDEKKEFAALDEPLSELRVLPDGVKMREAKARRDIDAKARYIAFYPNGACDEAKVTLIREDGRQLVVDTKGRLGQFKTKAPRE